jgi:glycosyltransferase involved in cell wall biosynthesis
MTPPPGARADRHILIVTQELPVAPRTGVRLRTYYVAAALSKLGRVTLAGFAEPADAARLAELPFRTLPVRWREPPLYAQMGSSSPSVWRPAWERLEHQAAPWVVSSCESPQLREVIAAEIADGVDLVVIEQTAMGGYLEAVPAGVPTVLDLHNVHTRMLAGRPDRSSQPAVEDERIRRYERRLIERADLVLVVSEQEAAAVRALTPSARVEVIPNGVQIDRYRPGNRPPTPGDLLFTGHLSYGPNVRAAEWFVREVLPRLHTGVLHVVGALPAPQVLGLRSARVKVHGDVPDTLPYQHAAELVVAPLRDGGGTRLKVLEAAACGNAIVSTSVGAEGLDLVPGRDLLVADTAEDFAGAVAKLLGDAAARERLGGSAQRAARAYDWERIGAVLRAGVAPLLARAPAGAGAAGLGIS